MTDDFGNRIQTFLNGVFETVMDGAERVGSDLRCREIRGSFKADCKRVQTRPPGFGLVVFFNALTGKTHRAGGDQR